MSTHTLQQQQKCINSLKIVNCREHKSQILSIYSLKCPKLSDYAILQIFLAFTNIYIAVHYQFNNTPH